MTAPSVLGNGQLRLDEVYLSGSTGQGPAVVGGIALLADGHGLTVLGPQPSSIRTMPWGRASTIACHRQAQLPDGRPAVVLEIDIDGHALRFFVPQANLGSDGAGALEQQLTALSRIPVAVDPPLAIGGEAAAIGTVAPGQPVTPAGPGPSYVPQGSQTVMAGAGQTPPGVLPPGVLAPGALPPATGGTIPLSQGFSAGQYVQAARRRIGHKGRVAAALVVVLIAGGAAGYVVLSHHGTTGSDPISGDALAAAQANLAPGDLPGWKGVPGTVAGAIGAFGFNHATGSSASGSGSANGSGVATKAEAAFSRCTKLPASEASAALAALGFSQGLAAVPDETALSSSPLFEDPTSPATSVESSVIVLGSAGEQKAATSVFAERSFAGCYSSFLTAVVPSLVGGATSTIPFAYVSVHATRIRSSAAGVSVEGFSETFYRKGRPVRSAFSGGIDVIASGRIIAVLDTIAKQRYPAAEGMNLLTSVEQIVGGESSS